MDSGQAPTWYVLPPRPSKSIRRAHTRDESFSQRAKIEKLARWKIDPSRVEFATDAGVFYGGHATVSKAFLAEDNETHNSMREHQEGDREEDKEDDGGEEVDEDEDVNEDEDLDEDEDANEEEDMDEGEDVDDGSSADEGSESESSTGASDWGKVRSNDPLCCLITGR